MFARRKMALIEGMDIATSTGLARLDRPGPIRRALCEFINVDGENAEEKAGCLAMAMVRRFRERKPDFVAIEMPQRNVKMFKKKGKPDLAGAVQTTTINPNTLQLSALAGAAVAILDAYHIPWGLIPTNTWRAKYYGSGFAPPVRVIQKKNGEVIREDDWKQAAINEAMREGVVLPGNKVEQGDAAEALAVAICWENCAFIPARHRNAFLALRMGKARAA
jgi:hypothetical protein